MLEYRHGEVIKGSSKYLPALVKDDLTNEILECRQGSQRVVLIDKKRQRRKLGREGVWRFNPRQLTSGLRVVYQINIGGSGFRMVHPWAPEDEWTNSRSS